MQFYNAWLRRYSKLTIIVTLILIFLGALVNSFGVGLSVPDWPTTYGKQMFAFPWSDMVGGIFYEHSHRMVATLVGALTVGLTLWLYFANSRINLKKLGFLALTLVILQGFLGGLTVLFYLPATISILHGITAQTFLLTLIIIAYALSVEFQNRKPVEYVHNKWIVLIFIAVFIQLMLGAWMRHTESGLAIYDFPLMAGQWLPILNQSTLNRINDWRFEMNLDPVTLFQVWIHFMHRLGATAIIVFTSIFGYQFFRNRTKYSQTIFLNVIALFTLIFLQIILGMLTIWSIKGPLVTSLHVLNGAGVLGTSFLLFLRTSNVSFLNN